MSNLEYNNKEHLIRMALLSFVEAMLRIVVFTSINLKTQKKVKENESQVVQY